MESPTKLLQAKLDKLSKPSISLDKLEVSSVSLVARTSKTLASWMTSQLDSEQPHRLEDRSLESLNKLLQAKPDLEMFSKPSESLAKSEASPDNLEARESFF